ncbi:MAG TPA: Rieske (2Fe-2S) protein, partial [Acidimicrobiaceae bacterium]|nr:Rieske (2Fe-2S) protein [Acidimicrobiaceae bacterium]
ALADLPDGMVMQVECDGTPVALARIGDRVFAIGDTCSHAEVSLSEGEIDVEECALECWRHGSLFSLETGEALTMPAVRPVPVYSVRIDGADVVMDS